MNKEEKLLNMLMGDGEIINARNMLKKMKDRYERQLRDLNKELKDKDIEITALKFYVQIFLFFCSVFAFLFFISLVKRG